MYQIRGADGKDYGPVNAETIRRWISERRANAQTLIRVENANEWKPLSGFPEFSGLLAGKSATPPPLAGGSDRPRSRPAKNSGFATASLVLGLLGLCTAGLGGILGLVFGLVALNKIGRSQGQLGGRGFAIAGLCVSAVTLFAGFMIALALLLPVLAKMKTSSGGTTRCASNLREVARAVRLYSADNSDVLPDAAKWCDLIQPHLPSSSALQCPRDRGQPPCSFGFNASLSGKDEGRVNPKTVLLFEMNGGWNGSGGAESMISRHGRTHVVAYVDGSVDQVSSSRLSDLRWEP